MGRKVIITIVTVAILAIGLLAKNLLSESKKPPQKQKVSNVAQVFTESVQNSTVPIILVATGQLEAVNRIDLFAEVQGLMLGSSKPFKPGTRYSKGQRLIQIESDIFRASLKSQKSNFQNMITGMLADLRLDYPESFEQWEDYVKTFDVNSTTAALPEPLTDQEKMFVTGRNIYSTYYSVKNAELTLSRYDIYAPFSGVLTEASVDPGTLIRPGQKLGTFIDPSTYELEAPVSQSMVEFLQSGQKVKVISSSGNDWEGKIIRINSSVNPNTQTVNVYVEVKGEGLEEGMFLEAHINATEIEDATRIDRSVLVEDSKVYVVSDSLLVEKTIEAVYFDEKTVVVKGLQDGEQVLKKMAPGFYPGMKVSIYQEKSRS
ncbi:MAG: efflux RND transporter periplasmic adaptor subunit [Flavobacteriales bacterium]|nr:efflux RND transporter periplasmic adaptor subunit [Flavobacteriales bacterium]